MITKGKWKIDGGTNKKGDLFIWKDGEYYGGHAIATVHGDIQERAEGNARLITAAPDLLEACKYAFFDSISLSSTMRKRLEVAIAKAETA